MRERIARWCQPSNQFSAALLYVFSQSFFMASRRMQAVDKRVFAASSSLSQAGSSAVRLARLFKRMNFIFFMARHLSLFAPLVHGHGAHGWGTVS